jgi:predicted unusual protein kinase regulating ubiquinone biosynthesis (AarF/ABC1/UbiB family)
MSKKIKETRKGRFLKLAGMTATVASRYAGDRVKSVFKSEEGADHSKRQTYAKMAEDVVDTLGELKGAVMKIGQIASQTQDLLPPEFSEALKKLQKEAPPVSFEQIREQVEKQLGSPLDQLFTSFSEEPYASASIGQVHRACTRDGLEVVVKVQYPGVANSCDSDLKQLRLALKFGGLLKLPKESVDALFEEIKARLHEELDYENEAKNIRMFSAFHKKHPKILIPEVIEQLSNKQILTMEYLPGDDVQGLASQGYTQEQINLLGERLFELMAEQLFEFKQIHGDPHPGNFAFRKDGSVIIYDFGCVKTLKLDILQAYKDAISSSLIEDYQSLDDALIRLGARVKSKPSPGSDYYRVWRNIFFEPFLTDEEYDYETASLHMDFAKHTSLFFKHIKHFSPPVESIYIDRMISGQYWILKSMGVKAEFRSKLDTYLK